MLAWPATLSFLLNNTYRLNDQFWIQGLGPSAQAAIGATMFVAIMSFAWFYFAAGGTLALVARHEGAGDPEERDRVARHALLLAVFLGGVMFVVGPHLIETITTLMGLTGQTRIFATSYLRGFFNIAPAMVVILAIDHIFIGRGVTLIPMLMQLVAVLCNFVLNPILIYGKGLVGAVDAAGMPHLPGLELAARVAIHFDLEGLGLEGAAIATGISRLVAGALGLTVLNRVFGLRLLSKRRPSLRLMRQMAKIAAPVSGSIAVYAGVYWALFGLVLQDLGDPVKAGLSIGFQVFEGVAFPTYLGIAMAGSSLVGRALGAGDRALTLDWVHLVRRTGYTAGLFFSVLFFFGAPHLVHIFTKDPAVAHETVVYTRALAFSQLFVSIETVNEKVLLGSGFTRPIGPITLIGNLIRLPLAWLMTIQLGWGAMGVWWSINLSTYFKAFFYRRVVQKREWLTHDITTDATASAELSADQVEEAARGGP
jgi:Na+-driven multidrug efflux pump